MVLQYVCHLSVMVNYIGKLYNLPSLSLIKNCSLSGKHSGTSCFRGRLKNGNLLSETSSVIL